jgi:peptidoglycan/xylan/chitin deacetylase (PgdA/CDA1 family)
MLEEMQRAGFTIGSHTASHALLTNESMMDILRELISSQSELKVRLGGATPYFAYPDGRFHGQAVRAVKSCRYDFAFSTCLHRDPEYPLLTVPRKVLWEKSCIDPFGSFDPSVMECLIARVFDFMSPCRKNHEFPEVSIRLCEAQSFTGLEGG